MKIIIADDHVLFRESLGEYLNRYLPDADVLFFSDFHEVYQTLKEGVSCDLVLLDYNMGGMNGSQGLQTLREEYPSLSVAIMSGVAERYQVRVALDLGAAGYFPKTLPGKGFVEGIRSILSGKKFVPVSSNSGFLMSSYQSGHSGQGKDSGSYVTYEDIGLSKREGEVLSALLKGHSNKVIASDLGIQEVTVKMHVSKICQKMHVKSRTQIVLKARDLGVKELDFVNNEGA